MRALFINNNGSGFADYIEVETGTTAHEFCNKQVPGYRPEDYLIRVNRQIVSREYVLQEGDRITMTPTKIQGA